MSNRLAGALVFFASGSVLVLEILAGRLLAPYVGVSIETFTGIIGVVLAGIAIGAWLGGGLADRFGPRLLLPGALTIGGALVIASVPLVRLFGPSSPDASPGTIVVLATVAFFAPSAVLTAVTPIVVKGQLRALDQTGRVVGWLSAMGTAGALVGVFTTGFVLVAAFPTTPVVIVLGALLVATGVALWFHLRRPTPQNVIVAGVTVAVLSAGVAVLADGPCEVESAYFCARVDEDPERSSGRILWLDTLRHSYVDLDDPTHLEFTYTQVLGDVVDSLAPPGSAIDAVHVGGGGFTIPRYVATTRPGSDNLVLELDPAVVDLAEDELGLRTGEDLRVMTGDARIAVADLPSDAADLVVGDAFGGRAVPWHLTTREFVTELARVLRDQGHTRPERHRPPATRLPARRAGDDARRVRARRRDRPCTSPGRGRGRQLHRGGERPAAPARCHRAGERGPRRRRSGARRPRGGGRVHRRGGRAHRRARAGGSTHQLMAGDRAPDAEDGRSGPRVIAPLREFLHTESAGGVILVVAAVVALVWANSPWKDAYFDLWHTDLAITLGDHTLDLDLQEWVNEGLMAIFFFVVGLEIKRELVEGELRGPRRAVLPAVAALGGMVVPALIYVAINAGGDGAEGWGIPMATDIAMAVGILSLLGSRVAPSLKLFLLAVAIVDDIGAIAVIAIFYTDDIDYDALLLAMGLVVALVVMRVLDVRTTLLPLVVGCGLWLALHESGLHATIAGVILGLMAPTRPHLQHELVDESVLTDLSSVAAARETATIARQSVSVVEWLEHVLHPWSSFVIVPLFALANAGVPISADALSDAVTSPITIGVLLGLVVGKLAGITAFTWLATRLGIGALPDGATWRGVVGVSAVAGIGFTVSLFITGLAFDDVGAPGRGQDRRTRRGDRRRRDRCGRARRRHARPNRD